jgi:hypothetical protein
VDLRKTDCKDVNWVDWGGGRGEEEGEVVVVVDCPTTLPFPPYLTNAEYPH